MKAFKTVPIGIQDGHSLDYHHEGGDEASGGKLYFAFDGIRIAQRINGKWQSIKPGWSVTMDGEYTEVVYKPPIRYFVARRLELETDPMTALTKRGVSSGIAMEAIEAGKRTWPNIYVPLLGEEAPTALVISQVEGVWWTYWADVSEELLYDSEAKAQAMIPEWQAEFERQDKPREVLRVFGFTQAGLSITPPTSVRLQ